MCGGDVDVGAQLPSGTHVLPLNIREVSDHAEVDGWETTPVLGCDGKGYEEEREEDGEDDGGAHDVVCFLILGLTRLEGVTEIISTWGMNVRPRYVPSASSYSLAMDTPTSF